MANPRDRRSLRRGAREPPLARSGFSDWPRSCLSVIREGRPAYGMAAVGKGMGSPGSERIIEAVDRDDPRPLWVLVWGGPNCLAQALWHVRESRSAEELETFVSRLRVYTISDQDDSGPWIRETFPNLFYVASPGVHAGGAYHHSTWVGISGDNFHGRFVGADFEIVDNPWLDQNVRSKGPLGAQYPQDEVPDGRRHAELPFSDQQRVGRSRASGLGQLGRPLRASTPPTEVVVPPARDQAVLERYPGRSHGRRRVLAHGQQGDHLALALRVPERLRRAHGLDRHTLRRGESPTGSAPRPCRPN